MATFGETLLGQGCFAVGVAGYVDASPQERNGPARIVIYLEMPNGEAVPAIVDTGAVWCILRRDVVSRCREEIVETICREYPRRIQGRTIIGTLHRMRMYLPADEGLALEIEATVFEPDEGQYVGMPNIIGLSGFLDRIRFAVNPAANEFYFGCC